MKTVADKTVLITGAAMGLGKLFAHKAVGDKAAAIVLWDINEHALKDTAAELEPAPPARRRARRRCRGCRVRSGRPSGCGRKTHG